MANEPTPTPRGAEAAAATTTATAAAAPNPDREAARDGARDNDREPGFDQVLERLRQVVSRLEQGSLSLEQALLCFEEGVRLSRRGGEILDLAEQRVELLLRGEDGERRQPLSPPQTPQAG